MQGRDFVVGEVHGNLRHVVFLDIPANGFHAFEFARDSDGFAIFIGHNLSGIGVAFAFYPTCLTHVERDPIGDACAFCV